MALIWVGFFVLIVILLAVDLGLLNRRSHVIGMKEATKWTVLWISLGVAFSGVVYLIYEMDLGATRASGATAMFEYLTGFVVEKSLSVDNIFVMAMIFSYFKVPDAYQHKVLFWGILGALVLRGAMIGIGVLLVSKFDWIFYVFGAFLVLTALRMIFAGDEEFDPSKSRTIRLARWIVPITDTYDGDRFTTRVGGRFSFTLLFLVVLIIEATDVVFAVDSIPAVFAITTDPFIVMTSNVFAILGLRALYFVVAGAMRQFRYLDLAVGIILVLVGVKMLLHHAVHIPAVWSLVGIVMVLIAGIWASVAANRRDATREAEAALEAAAATGLEGAKPAPDAADADREPEQAVGS